MLEVRVFLFLIVPSMLLSFLVVRTRHANYQVFRCELAYLRGAAGIVKDARRLDGRRLIQFGLLVLLATPIARVAFSVLAFALERDRTYVVVTLIVLAVLLYSLGFGGR